MAKTANDILKIASKEVGNTSGLKYWNYVFPNWKYVDGNVTPYCACFVSWVMHQGGVNVKGLPGGYCPSIRNANLPLIDAKKAQAGDIVLFDWQGDGICDHIGFVELNTGKALQTIEGNTNGGMVARRSRAYSTSPGVIRPAYSKPETTPKPAPSTNKKKTNEEIALEVIAGKWGSGSNRFNKLTAAGYNAGAIQKIVNDILKGKTKKYKVTAKIGLNVRKQPTTSASIVRVLTYNTTVTVSKTSNGWGYIGDGWCNMTYLKEL